MSKRAINDVEAPEQSCSKKCDTYLKAVAFKHMDCLKSLREKLGDNEDWDTPDKYLMQYACEIANIEALQWLHSQGLVLHDDCIHQSLGDVDCLRFCHEQGFVLTQEHAVVACEIGSIDCLKYLHEHGCSMNDPFLPIAAAEAETNGNHPQSACLEYLHTHGCPMGDLESLVQVAICNLNVDALKFIHEKLGFDFKSYDLTYMFSVCAVDDTVLDMFEYLVECGCPFRDTFVSDLVVALESMGEPISTQDLEFVLACLGRELTEQEAVTLNQEYAYQYEDLMEYPYVRRFVKLLAVVDDDLKKAIADADAVLKEIEVNLEKVDGQFIPTDVIRYNILKFL